MRAVSCVTKYKWKNQNNNVEGSVRDEFSEVLLRGGGGIEQTVLLGTSKYTVWAECRIAEC